MARKRIVKTYSDTRAKGERSVIKGNRYFVKVDLVSVKVTESADLFSRTSEIYFKCDRKRVPNHGTINIERNEVFKPSGGLTLYSQFKEKEGGGTEIVRVKVFDRDLAKDKELVDEKISVTLGQSKDYIMLDKNGIRAKIGISARKTRF